LVKYFLDGVKVTDDNISQTEALSYTSSLNIGRKAVAGFDAWGGKLDEIILYNRALTDGEVAQLYGLNILPIHLISFGGSEKEGNIILKWQSENENNFNHFDIEYSADGTYFYKLAGVNGITNNSSTKSYTYNHYNPQQGNNFYRLKQIDNDGSFVYSAIIKVQLNKVVHAVKIYPNPVKDLATINIYTSQPQSLKIIVTDVLGRVQLLKGNNVVRGSNEIKIDVSRLNNGIYYLRVLGIEKYNSPTLIKM
jgi:Secretion system C-terminal sorting domain/Concanavalin A-like lectin/glucanases superfamily